MTNEIIKQDMNFMEYPLYTLSENPGKNDISVVFGNKKFEVNVGYKTPNSTDMLFLYYFLKLSQENNYINEFRLTKYNVINNITNTNGGYYYNRLKESLKIWRNTGLSFEGTFYNGKVYETMVFGVLDEGKIEKDGKVYVKLNSTFLEIIEKSKFYRYINFEEFKRLRKPMARRLYEILKKSSLPLKIEIIKLSKKMNLSLKYPSDILKKLIPAINEISKQTDLKVEIEHYKNADNKTICVIKNKDVINDYKTLNDKEKKAFDKLENLNIKGSIIIDIINNYPLERIKKVYKYTIEQEPVNEAGFFRTALKENYDILTEDEREIKKRKQFLKKEAISKYNGACNYGNCGATWGKYQNREDSICHWCPKFNDRRSRQLSLEI